MDIGNLIYDKVIEINNEYQEVQRLIEKKGSTVELVTRKAVIVGKMETLSWAIEVMDK